MSHTHLEGGWILRDSDGAHIPPDPANRDRVEYQEWFSAGGLTNQYEQPVPSSVTRRQFRQALVKSRIRAAFEAAVAADQDTKDWYADSFTFERADPELATVATAIGKSDLEVNTLFKLAGTL